MVEDAQIRNAREIIQQCIELVELEPQKTFFLMRLHTDLKAALDALEAVQTIVVAPLADGMDVMTLVPPPQSYDISGIDDGEPSAYEVGE